MGGAGKAVSKAVGKIGDKVKDIGESNVARAVFNPQAAIARKFGLKTDIFNPAGLALTKATEKFVEQPRKLKEEAVRFEADARKEQAAQLKRLKGREAQSKAEGQASKDLERGRRRQAKRRGSQGRSSTILTDKLGGASGDTGKTLLGG